MVFQVIFIKFNGFPQIYGRSVVQIAKIGKIELVELRICRLQIFRKPNSIRKASINCKSPMSQFL